MSIRPDSGQVCDSCDDQATYTLCEKTSRWCANWFIGHYCVHCYSVVEGEMQRICQAEGVEPRVLEDKMTKPKLVKHKLSDRPGDYVYVRRHGVEPFRFLPALRRVFPNLRFRDPHRKDPTARRNPIYVAAGVVGQPRVYVRDEDGYVHQPVELTRTGKLGEDVLTWYRCMREVYDDLELPLPLEELTHTLHCLNAGGKLTASEAVGGEMILTHLYREEGNV